MALSEAAVAARTQRLNVNLPVTVYEELKALAESTGRNISELIRMALGLVKFVIEEERRGNRVYIGTPEGKILKEIVLPR